MIAVKIYPSVEECKIKNLVKCPEGCSAVFMCESNLKMHLSMTHGKTQPNLSEAKENKEYYCPEQSCVYHETKHIKSLKNLRQHYLKVHTEKEHVCVYCKAVFSSPSMLKRHNDFCGVSFNCCECCAKYDCYESLRTHCRRKDHHVHEKRQYKECYIETNLKQSASDPGFNTRYQPLLSCKPCVQENRTIQPKRKSKMTQVQRTVVIVPRFPKFTVHTQTNHTVSVETQTIGDSANINKLAKKNSNTQTDIVELQSTGCNTSFNLEETSDHIEIKEKSSSGTQTNYESQTIFNSPTETHYSSIHTDTSDLMMDDNLSSLDPFLNCNTETQTDFEMMSFGDILNGFSLTDNQTQTVFEPIDISSDKCDIFGSTDNQTQTVFDDLLRSVESQTMMSHVKKISASYVSTMETQTDNEFREMLEIINS